MNNMMIEFRAITLMLLILLASGCQEQPGQKEFREIERIPENGPNTRLEKFSSYSLDRQIDIFLYAQINLAGKRDTYTRYLANDGQSKKGQIAIRIDSTDSVHVKAELISVLDLIDLNCSCVHSDRVIMELLSHNEFAGNESDEIAVQISKETYKRILEGLKSRAE